MVDFVIPPITDPAGQTDVANARRLVRHFGKDLRFVPPWKQYLVFDGKRWRLDSSKRVIDFAKQVTDHLWAEARDSGGSRDALRWAATSADRRHVEAMAVLAAGDVVVGLQELNRDPWLLNCENGTIDLATGELRPHGRGDLITTLCPTSYDPNAVSETWATFLDQVFCSNQDLIGWVRRYLGSCLAGATRDHVLAVFHGDGANGKSTLFETLLKVLGEDLALKAPSELLLARKRDSHPAQIAALHGKRLVVCSETDHGRRFDEALVKELTGGDTITARRMRENPWSFRPTHNLVLLTNHPPSVVGVDNGIWRRIRRVPFARTFAAHEQDPRLMEKLLREAPGILTWLVRGCIDWRNSGLPESTTVRAATAEYRAAEDVIGRFIEDRCVKHPESRVKTSDFRAALQQWCRTEGETMPDQKRISQRLAQDGFSGKKSGVTFYLGLNLRTATERWEGGSQRCASPPSTRYGE